ncbi:MAG TPA: UDP-N-acetylglucosamine 2-epimerase (non-hydrolyzing) [Bacteroidales bacterium]|nr:UDP-N-acetylglucosamine 2-epimerase (non-hydrolyzing) [Bacteroidales bacterium]HPE56832.1 UDP-N-acetylglucosamine 2-epimerase (non-hydrolyzing) [Bacteroidales bacterium]HRX96374.1 UDP-N-acetylglucosamine 2-epimerase (non-hydrolyzing) [Bacteroidales bacterium]
MQNILTIIGARPQIIKAAALSRAIKKHFADDIKETIVHTGQHYDANMSQVFFDEMGIPAPDFNLNVGSGTHGKQTATMIEKIEELLMIKKPDFVVLYGDTNSTLAGAISASKIHIPIAHIEAGLRSFNKSMPEEINRMMCDHSSTLLFTPTRTGLNNLIHEGFNAHAKPPFTADNPGIFHCGDIMYDNSLYFADIAAKKSQVMKTHGLVKNNFILATIHRDNNTDIPERLNNIFEALLEISHEHNMEIVLPLHPRTNKMLEKNLETENFKAVKASQKLKLIPPASFFDMIELEKNCKMILTDSGGVQKEAYFFQKPVIILRPETEWLEIVENKTGQITDANKDNILKAFEYYNVHSHLKFPAVFGDGRAAEFICRKMLG